MKFMEQVAKEDYLRQMMIEAGQSGKAKGNSRIKIENDKIKYSNSVARLAAIEVVKNGKKVDQIIHKSQKVQLPLVRISPHPADDNIYRPAKQLDDNPLSVSADLQDMRNSRTNSWYNRSFMMSSLLKTHQKLRAKSEETEKSLETEETRRPPSMNRLQRYREFNIVDDSLKHRHRVNKLMLPALSITAKRHTNPLRDRDLSKESKKKTKTLNIRKDISLHNDNKQIFDLEAHMDSLRLNRDIAEADLKKRFFIKKKRPSTVLQDFNDYYMDYPTIINHSVNAVISIFEDFSPDMTEDKNNLACSISNMLEMATRFDAGGTGLNLESFNPKTIEEEADELQDQPIPLGVGGGYQGSLLIEDHNKKTERSNRSVAIGSMGGPSRRKGQQLLEPLQKTTMKIITTTHDSSDHSHRKKRHNKIISKTDVFSVRGASQVFLQGQPFQYISYWKNIINYLLANDKLLDIFGSIDYYSYFVWYNVEELLAKGRLKKSKKFVSNPNLKPQPPSYFFIKDYNEFKALHSLNPHQRGLDSISMLIWNVRNDLETTAIIKDSLYYNRSDPIQRTASNLQMLLEYARDVCTHRHEHSHSLHFKRDVARLRGDLLRSRSI